MKKKPINIKLVVLFEFLLFIAFFMLILSISQGVGGIDHAIYWFIDGPSIALVLGMVIPGLIIMGEWKDFIRAFFVGEKPYSLLELKNISEAVSVCQKLTICGGAFALLISLVILFAQLSSPEVIGPNLATCVISCFYVTLIEFLLLPVKMNVVKRLNEEMDIEFDTENIDS